MTDYNPEDLMTEDPIGEAEKAVSNIINSSKEDGKKVNVSYKSSEPVNPEDPESPSQHDAIMGLSLAFMADRQRRVKEYADQNSDTTLTNDLGYYLDVLESLGFKLALKDEISMSHIKRHKGVEHLYIFTI